MSFRLLFFLLLVSSSIVSAFSPDSTGDILGVFTFENQSGVSRFDDFADSLAVQLEKEMALDFTVKRWTLSFNDFFRSETEKRQKIRLALFGRFENGKDSTVSLRFHILDLSTGSEQDKTINASEMDEEDMARIILLKLKNFLEEGMLGRLNVASVPLGVSILLDQKYSGKTPKEFLLKAGTYHLELQGEFVQPYKQFIDVLPGRNVNLKAEMEFKGYPTSLWILGSAVVTWECLMVWILENSFHDDYRDAVRGQIQKSPSVAYRDYKNTRLLRFSLLGVAGAGWIGTGFCYFSNKSLKTRYFGKND